MNEEPIAWLGIEHPDTDLDTKRPSGWWNIIGHLKGWALWVPHSDGRWIDFPGVSREYVQKEAERLIREHERT